MIGRSILFACAQKCANWKTGRSGRKSCFGNDSTYSAVSDGACAAARFARCAATKTRIGRMLRLWEIAIGKTRVQQDGSAYPECNKTGEWKSLKHNRQMMNRRAYEIRKLQGKVAKCVAPAAAGQRQKKKLKKRKN